MTVSTLANGKVLPSGIATGYVDLDNLTAGLQNDELVIIAARPSVGKTSFALNIARHAVVDEGKSVLFVSLEQVRASKSPTVSRPVSAGG